VEDRLQLRRSRQRLADLDEVEKRVGRHFLAGPLHRAIGHGSLPPLSMMDL
jgi:hypothetical protein